MHFLAERSGNALRVRESVRPLHSEPGGSIHVDVVDVQCFYPTLLSFRDREHPPAAVDFPAAIDPDYFQGEFLYRSGERPAALVDRERVSAAPSRADRPLADAGRRRQVQALIQTIKSTH